MPFDNSRESSRPNLNPTPAEVEAFAQELHAKAVDAAEAQRAKMGWDEALPVRPIEFHRAMAEEHFRGLRYLSKAMDRSREYRKRTGRNRTFSLMGQGR